MCTVTFIPKANQGFILTSNRDETPKRQPEGIYKDLEKGLIYPKEPSKGGTWICADQHNRLLCILNGAFEKHKHRPPYRRSRGLLVLDFFEYSSAQDFVDHYNFDGIEPFTLVIYEKGNLYELRWDEKKTHFTNLDAQQAHIWSSSTLYPPQIKELRESWFNEWQLSAENPMATEILKFHQTAGNGDPENDLLMSRHGGIVQTVSITQFNSEKRTMLYLDLVNDKRAKRLF
jgi:uncharacterized protein with NRDE domain